jgi:hypothetical protein
MEACRNSNPPAADDTITIPGVVSFSWIRTTKGGDVLSYDDFDMPLEPYGVGWRRGEAAAKECLQHAARGVSEPLHDALKRAFAILAETDQVWDDILSETGRPVDGKDPNAPSQRGAAAGFVRTVEHHAIAAFRLMQG